ncbi:PAS domain S-box protein [Halovenus rubra]|uniref:histidine kinase n=2 Tax=Halovenus rubra TaxID=869890 RepID=A0ABD5XCB9_9EURY|nr:PAS domain S-box protein [Halovenus rubra]
MTHRIQVVHLENESEARTLTAEQLEGGNDRIEVTSVPTVDEATERLSDIPVDCVLSEYQLPESDGLEFLSWVRERWPELPFIMYTAHDSEAVASEALSEGATDYIKKSNLGENYELLAQRIVTATEQYRANKNKRTADLVREIQSTLVQAQTREEIEDKVCTLLTDANPYAFSWIGSVDVAHNKVEARASAGDKDGYLDAIETAIGDSTIGQGPTGEAIRTRSSQIVQDISNDPVSEPWRKEALDCGYRSSASVPIEYERDLYGVLNVYAAHQGAFDTAELALLEEIAEAVAHAMHQIRIQNRYESRYQSLYEDAPVMIALIRAEEGEPVIEDCNPQFAAKLGYPTVNLSGVPLANIYSDESTTKLLDEGGHQRAIDGEFTPSERELITADGERLVTLLQASPRRDKSGTVVGTYAMFVDITDRKRAQSVLEQAEAMETSMDGMGILDGSGEFVYLNQAYAEIHGYDKTDRLLHSTWQQLYDDDTIQRFEDDIIPVVDETGEWRGEITGLRADGSTFPQELSLTKLDDNSFVAVVRDITEQKEREQTLEKIISQIDKIIDARSKEQMGEIAINIAEDALGSPLTGVHLLSPDQQRLESIALIDQIRGEFSEPPTYERAADNIVSEVVWNAFEQDGPQYIDDTRTYQNLAEQTPARSAVLQPLGDHGILIISRTETHGFDRTERNFAEVLSQVLTAGMDRCEREKELDRAQERMRALFDEAPDSITVHNTDGDIVDTNEQLTEKLGYTRDELTSMNVRDFVATANTEDTQEIWRGLDIGETHKTEITHRRKDGSTYPVEVWLSKVQTGGKQRFIALSRDITERKERERELERKREFLQRTQEVSEVGGWEADLESETLRWTDEVYTIHGKTRDFKPEIDDAIELYHPEDRETIKKLFDRLTTEGESYDRELRIVRDDGEVRWVRARGTPQYDDDVIVGARGTFQDITDRKEREQQIQKLKERLELAVEGAEIGVWDWNLRTDDVTYNEQWAAMLGYSLDEIDQSIEAWERRVHPDDLDSAQAELDAHFAGEVDYYDAEHRMRTADGEWKWIRTLGRVFKRDDNENPVRAVGIHIDINGPKQREQQLTQFQAAVEQTAQAVYILDSAGVIEYVNPAVAVITGYTEDEKRGQTAQFLETGSDTDEPSASLWETITAGDRWEDEILYERADGEEIILYLTISPITGDEEKPTKFVAVAQDVTDRKEYEKTLEQAQETLREIIDLVPDPIFVKDRDGTFLLANEATAEVYGQAPETLEEKKESAVVQDEEKIATYRQQDREVIETGEPIRIPEQDVITANGETRIYQTTKIPYKVPEVKEVAALGYARDVTEIKEYERRLETQRDNLGILNQVVRHDIRNQLQLVLTYTEVLQTELGDGTDEYITQVLEAARDAINITRTARDVTEVMLQPDIEQQSVPLRFTLENEIDAVRSNNQHALIKIKGAIPSVKVLADDMLESVFRNLLSNAIQHNDKEVPEITVSASQKEETVVVRIADNGPGIPDEQKDDIFQQGEMGIDSDGTGLGLYLVDTLVDRYDGKIEVADNEPEGAVFVLELSTAKQGELQSL